MSLEADIDASVRQRAFEADQRHEEAMKGVILKKARIEARRDVLIARSKSDSYLIKQCFIGAFCVLIAFIVCAYGQFAYNHSKPADRSVQLEQQKSNDARYMACLAKGWEFDTSNNQCNQP